MARLSTQFDSSTSDCRGGRSGNWKTALADAVTDPFQLCRLLELPRWIARASQEAAREFTLRVPRAFLARIRIGDPDDPLLWQVLPRKAERDKSPGFVADPLGEARATWGRGLLRKYSGRALMVATGACAVHCRYCFRRHFPCQPAETTVRLLALGDRIATEPSIREVILSGGDPLMLGDTDLAEIARRLEEIPHLQRLRIHTRLPVMIPQRVTEELLAWLRGTRLTTIMVVHINHPAEIDAHVARAIDRLIDAGVPVLNQSVLLRGINDRIEVLAELCQRLVDLRVQPYYLHQLDRVAGAAHFEVPEEVGVRLIHKLRAQLPGYAVPRYVRERPGAPAKVVLA